MSRAVEVAPPTSGFLRTIGGEYFQAGERSLTTPEAVHSNRVINRSKTRLEGGWFDCGFLCRFLDKNGFEERPGEPSEKGQKKT